VKNVSQTIARLYADALSDIGEEHGHLGQIVEDLHAVQELYDGHRDFYEFFVTPRMDPTEKKRILRELLGDKVGREVMGLLCVLIDKRRELVFDNIVGEFHAIRDLRAGIVNVYLTTARPMEADLRADIEQRLEKVSGKKIKFHEKVDSKVLGGLFIKVGDRVMDGTLRHRLEQLRREMVATRE
jgi:F-type H+-transporting ATPase subunit delta